MQFIAASSVFVLRKRSSTGYDFQIDSGDILEVTLDGASATVTVRTPNSVAGESCRHVAFTADRDGLGTLYVDGSEVASGDISGTGSLTVASSLFLGGRAASTTLSYGGRLAEFIMGDRVWTPLEVRWLHNNGNGNQLPLP